MTVGEVVGKNSSGFGLRHANDAEYLSFFTPI